MQRFGPGSVPSLLGRSNQNAFASIVLLPALLSRNHIVESLVIHLREARLLLALTFKIALGYNKSRWAGSSVG